MEKNQSFPRLQEVWPYTAFRGGAVSGPSYFLCIPQGKASDEEPCYKNIQKLQYVKIYKRTFLLVCKNYYFTFCVLWAYVGDTGRGERG